MRQPNLMCAACYHGVLEGIICGCGYKPDVCMAYEPKYTCKGGLVFKQPVTKQQCYECAKSCAGCMRMRVAYGFARLEDVRHLIEC